MTVGKGNSQLTDWEKKISSHFIIYNIQGIPLNDQEKDRDSR